MSKNRIITVNQIQITQSEKNNEDYISLTDMVRDNGGNDKIKQWIRNKDTVEFLGVWEELNNPNFNSVEFHRIMYEAGVQRFTMSLSQWIEKTNAVGVVSKAGKGGGTYAHKDIAFEFGTYLSPIFKLLLIKEFQRLKEEESKQIGGVWDIRRFISKVNYRIQTDAIKESLVPIKHLPKEKEGLIYAEEAEIACLDKLIELVKRNMNNEFIPYKQAISLQELNFNEPCMKVYYQPDNDREQLIYYLEFETIGGYYIKAPLYQQAFRWFREKHNLLGNVYSNASGWLWEIHDNIGGTHRSYSEYSGDCEHSGSFTSFRKAEIACLDKLIELVKKK